MTPPTHTRQNYIDELKTGAKTTQDMVFALGVSGGAVARMMKLFREKGIVKTVRMAKRHGNCYRHELLPGWEAKMVDQPLPRLAIPVSEEELLCVAHLSNDHWTGQRLCAEHRKAFPNGRTDNGILRLKEVARDRYPWCR